MLQPVKFNSHEENIYCEPCYQKMRLLLPHGRAKSFLGGVPAGRDDDSGNIIEVGTCDEPCTVVASKFARRDGESDDRVAESASLKDSAMEDVLSSDPHPAEDNKSYTTGLTLESALPAPADSIYDGDDALVKVEDSIRNFDGQGVAIKVAEKTLAANVAEEADAARLVSVKAAADFDDAVAVAAKAVAEAAASKAAVGAGGSTAAEEATTIKKAEETSVAQVAAIKAAEKAFAAKAAEESASVKIAK